MSTDQTEQSDILHMTLSSDELSVILGTGRDPEQYVALDLPVDGGMELGRSEDGREFIRVVLSIPNGMLKPVGTTLFGPNGEPIKRSLTISGLQPHLHLVLRKDALTDAAIRELDGNLRQVMLAHSNNMENST